MKIEHTVENLSCAQEIIEWLTGESDTRISCIHDPTMSLRDGTLSIHSGLEIHADDIVLLERMEDDLFGCGWDEASPEDVLNWIEEYCQPVEDDGLTDEDWDVFEESI